MNEHAARIIRVVNSNTAGSRVRHELARQMQYDCVAFIECVAGSHEPRRVELLSRSSGVLMSVGHEYIENNCREALAEAEIGYAARVLQGKDP